MYAEQRTVPHDVQSTHRSDYPHHQHSKPQPSSQPFPRRWMIFVGGSIMFFMLIAAVGTGLLIWMLSAEDTYASNVTVGDIAAGGLTEVELRTQLEQNPPNQILIARDGTRTWQVPAEQLGIALDIEATLAAARNASPGTYVQPLYTIDLVKTQEGLVFLSDLANVEALAGDPPRMGRSMDVPAMLNRLYLDVTGEIGDGVLDLTMLEIQPPEPEAETVVLPDVTTTHVVEQGQELALIAGYYNVSMTDIIAINELENPDMLYVGQELIIPAAGRYQPTQAEAPVPSTSTGKAIVVSTGEQRIYAYENGKLIRSHVVSTGRAETPTVKGDYKIYVKFVADDMSGPDYFMPQVPYTMYFYQGYGIHGTYWHNSFGRPMSHGCVNLPTAEAEWFFNWAEVGTPVRVI